MEQTLNNNQQTNQSINNQNNQTMEQTTTIPTTTEVITNEFLTTVQSIQTTWNKKVDDSLGSLFTKEDVKNIIKQSNEQLVNECKDYFVDVVNAITQMKEQEVTPALSQDIAQLLKDKLQDIVLGAMEDMYMKDYVEVTDESFEIDYRNQVCLDSYELEGDVNMLARDIASGIQPELIELLTQPQVADC